MSTCGADEVGPARNYEVLRRRTGPRRWRPSGERPSVVTLDLGLPPHPARTEEGFARLASRCGGSHVKIIIITGQDEKEHALDAIGQGAYDFFCKPVQLDELGTS